MRAPSPICFILLKSTSQIGVGPCMDVIQFRPNDMEYDMEWPKCYDEQSSNSVVTL